MKMSGQLLKPSQIEEDADKLVSSNESINKSVEDSESMIEVEPQSLE